MRLLLAVCGALVVALAVLRKDLVACVGGVLLLAAAWLLHRALHISRLRR